MAKTTTTTNMRSTDHPSLADIKPGLFSKTFAAVNVSLSMLNSLWTTSNGSLMDQLQPLACMYGVSWATKDSRIAQHVVALLPYHLPVIHPAQICVLSLIRSRSSALLCNHVLTALLRLSTNFMSPVTRGRPHINTVASSLASKFIHTPFFVVSG